MTGPADLDAIASIADPAERAIALRARVRERGTLTTAESVLYRGAVAELRHAKGTHRWWIAQLLNITPGAVTRLLTPKRTAAQPEGATS